jgi:chemotaxis protein CheZ
VNSMMQIWGVEGSTPSAPAADIEDRRPDAHLINGPAADGGPSQAAVDALFEQLGKATEPSKSKPRKAAETGKSEQTGSDKSSQKASQSQIDAMFNTAT